MVSTHPTGVQHSGSQYLPQRRDSSANPSPNQELLPLTARVDDHHLLEIGGCDVTTLVEQ
ncbi:MAG: diaminopimelate decarboxylase, partial [Nostoc sp.]